MQHDGFSPVVERRISRCNTEACGILVLRPGAEHKSPCLGRWILFFKTFFKYKFIYFNWTAREVPSLPKVPYKHCLITNSENRRQWWYSLMCFSLNRRKAYFPDLSVYIYPQPSIFNVVAHTHTHTHTCIYIGSAQWTASSHSVSFLSQIIYCRNFVRD